MIDIFFSVNRNGSEESILELLPSPSASSKFASSILKFFKHAQFFMYTQNYFGILKLDFST